MISGHCHLHSYSTVVFPLKHNVNLNFNCSHNYVNPPLGTCTWGGVARRVTGAVALALLASASAPPGFGARVMVDEGRMEIPGAPGI